MGDVTARAGEKLLELVDPPSDDLDGGNVERGRRVDFEVAEGGAVGRCEWESSLLSGWFYSRVSAPGTPRGQTSGAPRRRSTSTSSTGGSRHAEPSAPADVLSHELEERNLNRMRT